MMLEKPKMMPAAAAEVADYRFLISRPNTTIKI